MLIVLANAATVTLELRILYDWNAEGNSDPFRQ